MSNKRRKQFQRHTESILSPTGAGYRGQEKHNNIYCPKCKATTEPHETGCDGKKVKISAKARFPKKTASDKTWKRFHDKFVLKLGLTEIAKRKPKKMNESFAFVLSEPDNFLRDTFREKCDELGIKLVYYRNCEVKVKGSQEGVDKFRTFLYRERMNFSKI